jgi:hypothetical protein
MNDNDKHMEGFEKEDKLKKMHSNLDIRNRLYKWHDFMTVARVLNPELCEGAFERRPCHRKLRYIGYDNFEEPAKSNKDNKSYVYGNTYNSIDFNGATYTIRETGKLMGCAYFEVIGINKTI